jgi:hypothetical protein
MCSIPAAACLTAWDRSEALMNFRDMLSHRNCFRIRESGGELHSGAVQDPGRRGNRPRGNPPLIPPRRGTGLARSLPDGQFPSWELCITHKFSNRSPSNPNGIPPQSPGLGGTTYPGNNVQEAFSTPKVLRQSSAIWAQPRWGCFEAGPRTQGRPAAVAEGQPWAGGRNPVGIKGNEAAP